MEMIKVSDIRVNAIESDFAFIDNDTQATQETLFASGVPRDLVVTVYHDGTSYIAIDNEKLITALKQAKYYAMGLLELAPHNPAVQAQHDRLLEVRCKVIDQAEYALAITNIVASSNRKINTVGQYRALEILKKARPEATQQELGLLLGIPSKQGISTVASMQHLNKTELVLFEQACCLPSIKALIKLKGLSTAVALGVKFDDDGEIAKLSQKDVRNRISYRGALDGSKIRKEFSTEKEYLASKVATEKESTNVNSSKVLIARLEAVIKQVGSIACENNLEAAFKKMLELDLFNLDELNKSDAQGTVARANKLQRLHIEAEQRRKKDKLEAGTSNAKLEAEHNARESKKVVKA